MDNITMVKEWDDGQLYKLNGTNKGVRIIWGYATNGTGMHLWNDAWAIAELGTVDDDGEFEEDLFTDGDMYKEIFSRQMIGRPRNYLTYSLCDADGEEVNWDIFNDWAMTSMEELFNC